jgi:adenine-specific DNA-methyltransferase
LVYTKNKKLFQFIGLERDMSRFKKDEKGYYKDQYLQRIGRGFGLKKAIDPVTKKEYVFESPYSQEKIDYWIKTGKVLFSENRKYPLLKEYLSDYKNDKKQIATFIGYFPPEIYTKKIIDLFGGEKLFFYQKPDDLIKYLIKVTTDKEDIVLDFFAGTGTTGDAVMQQNVEDLGNRKFILCQQSEIINESHPIYSFMKNCLKKEPDIYELCKERLIRVKFLLQNDVIPKEIEKRKTKIRANQGSLFENDSINSEQNINMEKEIEILQKIDLSFEEVCVS